MKLFATKRSSVVFFLLTILISFGTYSIGYGQAEDPPPADENTAPVFIKGESTTRTVAENTASGTSIGTSVAATDADNDTLTYTLSENIDAAAFSIVSTTGQIQTKDALDFETKNAYSVTVNVSDGNGGSDAIDVTINVTNVNEAPVFTEGARATRTIAENTASGTNIGAAFTATDPDSGDTLTYSLHRGDRDAFRIDPDTGQLQTRDPLDFETKNAYDSLAVRATDSSGLTDAILITINVTDVNENRAPTFNGGGTSLAVAENTATGTDIGEPFTATDLGGDSLTYSLSGTDASSFSIASTTGQIQTIDALDFETKNAYSVTVNVSDGNGGSDAIDVTINVTNVNEAPVFTEGARATRTIAENTASGANIGAAFTATDPDSGDTLTYSLHRGDRDAFRIDPDTGQLQTRDSLDFETKNAYDSLAVRATDSSGLTDAILITINVTDVNEIPTFNGSGRSRTVAENTASGTDIGEPFTATDPDGDSLTYSLYTGQDMNAFSIVSTTGQIQTKDALDFETKNAYSFVIAVSDGKDSVVKGVTINVTDVNEIDPPLSERTQQVRDAIVDAVPNVNNADEVTYTHLAAITKLYLRDRGIKSLKSSDFSDLTALTGLYLSNNSITDIPPLQDLTNLTYLDLSYNSITDISPLRNMTSLTTLHLFYNSITDISPLEDLTALTYLYLYDNSITDVSPLEDLTNLTNLSLSGNPISDYEPLRRLQTAIQNAGNAIDIDIDITNNLPTFTDGGSTTRSVAEYTASGRNIGAAISATDADSDDILTYSLGGTDAESFDILSGSGQLQTSAALDYETKNAYTVTITVSDGNNGSDRITVTINVTDVDETSITPVNQRTQKVQDAIVNAIRGVHSADEVTYTHLSAITELNLSVSGITALKSGDFSGLTSLTTLSLHHNSITDISPLEELTSLTELSLYDNSITDISPLRNMTALTTLYLENNSITDVSPLEGLTSLTTLYLSYNSITDVSPLEDLTNLEHVFLSGNPISDYEPLRRLQTAIQNAGNYISIDIDITNNIPTFTDGGSTTRSVAEYTASGRNIGAAISATDADSDDTLTYSLGGTDAESFDILSDSGQLQTSAALDYETKNAYTVTITVSDGNDGSDRITVTINVTDVDETSITPVNQRTQQVRDAIVDAVPDVDNADEVTYTQLAAITELNLRDSGITALKSGDFSGLTSLTHLELDNNSITDISPLEGLTSLTDLYLSNNSITDVSPLEDLTSLTNLSLSGNPISDYEPLRRLQTAIQNAGNSINIDIDITNNIPTFTDGGSTTRSVAEYTASGTNIGAAISATDADSDDTLTYSLGGTDAESFSIVSDSGQLQTSAALDYETKNAYTVTITVSDGNDGSDRITVTINVTDVDETSITPVNQRTQKVQDAIVNRVSDAHYVDEVTYTHLAAITGLSVSGITSLKSGDFSGLTSLTYLSLYDNSITDISPLEDLTALTHLELHNNSITDISPLRNMTALTTLYLSNNSITDISPLEGLTSLTHLYLVNNSITDISPLEGLTSLPSLYLSNNSITDISPLRNMTALTTLELDDNSITDVSPLEDLTNLEHVFLSGNPISDYEPLRRLQTAIQNAGNYISVDIDITNNIPTFTDGGSTTRSVAEYTASGRNIGAAISATDADSDDTLTYSLGGTDAESFSIVGDSGQLQASAALDYETKNAYTVTITVSDGNDGSDRITVTINVTDVDETSITPVNQRAQQVQNAIVDAVPDVDNADEVTYTQLAAITELNLSVSGITALKSSDFSGLPALTDLDLYNNSITDISPLEGLTSLTDLGLSYNSITDISPLEGLTSLTDLDLYNNSITDISPLEGLTSLTDLYLYDNSITDISPLEGLTSLTDLFLENNSITDVSPLEDLINLKYLSLSGNPISDYQPLRRLQTAIQNAGNSITIDIDMTNNPPVFTDGDSVTRSIAENTAAGINIGAAVSAADADNHTLTYSLGGTDAESFDILSDSGQLQTKDDLDYETKASYTVTVTVYDGNSGGDRITVTINVTDAVGAAPSAQGTSVIPDKTALLTNYPNPFNPETWIPYQLAKPAEVTLTIYDIRGVVVRELKLGHQAAGMYHSRSRAIHWDGRNNIGEQVATGVYFYTFKAGDFTATRKLLIRK